MTGQFFASGSWIPSGPLITGLIQSTLLLAVGLLAGRLLRKRGPAVQSALYRTTLAAIFLCPVASALVAAMGFNGLLVRLPTRWETEGLTRVNEPPAHHADALTRPHEAPSVDANRLRDSPTPLDPASATGVVPPLVASAAPGASPSWADVIGWASVLLTAAWLLGAVVLGARLAVGQRRMARVRSCAIAAEADVQDLCRDLARRMSLEPPPVLRSPFLSSPCLDGLRRPAILLPEDADQNLRETFIHELAHLKRGDGLWNLSRHGATVVFWIQPLLWLLSKRLEAAAEEVCDDYVVDSGADRSRYARHLLELAERRLPPRALSSVGMISLRSLLARRVARILDSTRTTSTQAGGRAVAATLVAGLAGTLLAGQLGVSGGDRAVLGDEPRAATGPRAQPPAKPSAAPTKQAQARTMPITGRIVDLEGRPLAGVALEVIQITKPKGDELDPWIKAVTRGQSFSLAYQHLIYEPAIAPGETRPKTTTDAQGRFRLDGLEAERVVQIVVQGPTISYRALTVITRPSEPFSAKGFPSSHGPGPERILGSEFTYAATPTRPVEGVVRDARTNQPLAGVAVVSDHFVGATLAGVADLKTTTDGQGRFRLAGLPKGSGNAITALPRDDQPFFLRIVPVPDPPGMAPARLEIALHEGIWIEGKVTDQETGEPVQGAWLHYFPFLDNPFAQATPEFEPNGGIGTYQDRYQTKSDGSYRMVGLAGRAIIGVDYHSRKPYLMGDGAAGIKGMNKSGHFETWRNPINPSKYWPTSMKEINPTVGTKVIHVDFQLTAGATVRVRVVDLRGELARGLELAGRLRRGRETEVMPEAEFAVAALGPGEDRMVLIRHEARKLGKVVHVKPGDDRDGPVTVTLEPLATLVGRLSDADGDPVAGATVRAIAQPGRDFALSLGPVATDEKGRFVVPNVPIGCEYAVVAKGSIFTGATVRPGESTDVGEMHFKRD